MGQRSYSGLVPCTFQIGSFDSVQFQSVAVEEKQNTSRFLDHLRDPPVVLSRLLDLDLGVCSLLHGKTLHAL
jgi:hypothetical protein